MSHNLKPLYLTTPIYYINARPHLGTAYTTALGDIFTRYRRFFGGEAFFLTGLDEHGQKALASAKAAGLAPKDYCNAMRDKYKKAWDRLLMDIDWRRAAPQASRRSLFFRTSHRYEGAQKGLTDHAQAVREALQTLHRKGDIYQGVYRGWYCSSEEAFYSEKDLIGGKTPSGKETQFIEEKNYFFKMSKYQAALLRHIDRHPQFIRPAHRQNEIKGFLKKPLQDLCVSRPKARVAHKGGAWGIETPFDPGCTVYVWVDALLNYVNGAGYEGRPLSEDEAALPDERKASQKSFKKWWLEGEAVHLIGKDILMTHGVYWPCLLMALGLPLPQTIIAHGWLLNKEEGKMSKSEGEALDPLQLADQFGADEIRYFLASEIPLGRDGAVSEKIIEKRIHEDLSHTLGNLFSRLSRLVERHFKGIAPPLSDSAIAPQSGEETAQEGQKSSKAALAADFVRLELSLRGQLKERALELIKGFEGQIRAFQLHEALAEIQALLKQVNVYLERTAPWQLAKKDPQATAPILSASLEAVRISGLLLFPVMPQKTERLLRALSAFEVRETAPPSTSAPENAASSAAAPLAVASRPAALLAAVPRAAAPLSRPSGLCWGGLKGGERIEALQPLFPKRDRMMTDRP